MSTEYDEYTDITWFLTYFDSDKVPHLKTWRPSALRGDTLYLTYMFDIIMNYLTSDSRLDL